MTGERYGRLTVVQYLGSSKWECICDCGVVKPVARSNLTGGQIMSCGCLFVDTLNARNTTHGRSKTATYKSWSQAKSRCNLKSSPDYEYYGGRGVTMCDRWINDFAAFISDMGEKPPGTSLDRIDNNGNYEPGNCRWATKREQANNRRTTEHITAFGETKPFSQWLLDTRCVVAYSTLSQRIRQYGWEPEEALTTPPGNRRVATPP